jgi:hypothetical protein
MQQGSRRSAGQQKTRQGAQDQIAGVVMGAQRGQQSAGRIVDLSRQAERVVVDDAKQHDQSGLELWNRDVRDIIEFSRHELEHPGKAPKSSVELFLKLFLDWPHPEGNYS